MDSTRLRERRTVVTYGESSQGPSTSSAAQDRAASVRATSPARPRRALGTKPPLPLAIQMHSIILAGSSIAQERTLRAHVPF